MITEPATRTRVRFAHEDAAEAYAALKRGWQKAPDPQHSPTGDSGLDPALGIASASSIQIATFVAPLVVLYSLFAHPMNLVFSPVEIAILALLVVIFAYIGQDGESNWLEGAQLLALDAMAAVLFYALPVSAFGSWQDCPHPISFDNQHARHGAPRT